MVGLNIAEVELEVKKNSGQNWNRMSVVTTMIELFLHPGRVCAFKSKSKPREIQFLEVSIKDRIYHLRSCREFMAFLKQIKSYGQCPIFIQCLYTEIT